MINVAVTYSAQVGGSSVLSLRKAFVAIGCNVIDADYRLCSEIIPKECFEDIAKQDSIWSHLKFEAHKILCDCHCLVLSGSNAMIDSTLFNVERKSNTKYDISRGMSELALIHTAVNKGMPILGVCAGHQLLSVYFGGTLKNLTLQELESQNLHGDDAIFFRSGCVLSRLIGHKIQSFFGSHRQVVDQLGLDSFL